MTARFHFEQGTISKRAENIKVRWGGGGGGGGGGEVHLHVHVHLQCRIYSAYEVSMSRGGLGACSPG